MASNDFMDNLRRIMADRRLTINELARRSGVHHVMIRGYLQESDRGKLPSIETLVALARALHCDLEALTGHEELRGVVEVPKSSPDAEALYDYFTSLPEGDTMREILQRKIYQMLEDNMKKENGT